MLKKIYNILVLSAIFTLVCCLLLLSYKPDTISYLSYEGKDALLNIAQNHTDQFWKELIEHLKGEDETTWTTVAVSTTTLGPCPDTPPKLIGPLRVEFDQRTWDDVRAEASPALQEGGRYKPPDCISKHKVGKFNQRDK